MTLTYGKVILKNALNLKVTLISSDEHKLSMHNPFRYSMREHYSCLRKINRTCLWTLQIPDLEIHYLASFYFFFPVSCPSSWNLRSCSQTMNTIPLFHRTAKKTQNHPRRFHPQNPSLVPPLSLFTKNSLLFPSFLWSCSSARVGINWTDLMQAIHVK